MFTPRTRIFWAQAAHLTAASLKARYRNTFAGFLWVVMGPLAMFGVQSLVFRRFLRLDVPDYLLFLAGGLLPWIFMVQTVQMGAASLVIHAPLLRAFKLNPLVVVAASALDNLLNFLAAFILILVPLALASDSPVPHLWIAPLAMVPFVVGTGAMTAGLALLNVFHRDTNFVLGFLFSLLFFLTPVFYPAEYVPESYRWMVEWNVLHLLIQPFHAAVYPHSGENLLLLWLKGASCAAGLTVGAAWYWKRKRRALIIAL